MFVCTSCSNSESSDEQNFNISEALKIRTWLLDEELEGKGHWGYIDPSTRTFPRKEDGDGYWIPDDGETQVANEDVFVFEELEVGVPRTMAPMSMHMAREKGDNINYSNLNLHIEFDGIIEVTKIEPTDDSIILKYSLSGPPIESEDIKINAPCVINVCPVGKNMDAEGKSSLIITDTLVEKEYTIQIRGCSFDGTPIVTAQIKLTTISDPEYPWQTVHKGKYDAWVQSGEEMTRFCSIELLSYSYNDMYILRGEAGNVD